MDAGIPESGAPARRRTGPSGAAKTAVILLVLLCLPTPVFAESLADADEDAHGANDAAYLESAPPPCQRDQDCPACTTCDQAACTEPVWTGCNGDCPVGATACSGGCPAGQVCLASEITPCTMACFDAECTTDGDCGPCRACHKWSGKCEDKPVGCQYPWECKNGTVCKKVAGLPCENKCVPGPDAGDGGTSMAEVVPDAADAAEVDGAPVGDATAGPDGALPGDTLDAALPGDAPPAGEAAAAVTPPQPGGCRAGQVSSTSPLPLAVLAWLLRRRRDQITAR